ncbi:MAG: SDR family NAD(P)-dependent oxidoreductase [Thermoplasmatota archaeon]
MVTGGSRGIGAACVRACSGQGALTAFTYLKSRGEALRLAGELGEGVIPLKADTSDLTAMESVMDDFSGMGDRKGIDGLVVNAGIYRRSEFRNMELDDWRRTLGTNLDGAFIAVRSALAHMRKGSIVMISSQLAHKGSGHGADYAASKAGILGLSRSLARELAPDVRVNTVSPGYIDTDILAGDSGDLRARRIAEVPQGRIGEPLDVAGAVVFLLSDMSSYVTGSDLDVNGGLFIH